MTFDERLILIRNNDLFSQLTEEEVEELNLVHHFIEAEKGSYIYFESHHLDRLYFIKQGYIKIGYITEEGEEIVKEIIGEGDVFGQFSLEPSNLNGEFARVHKSDVSLCAFRIQDFEKLLRNKPNLAIAYSRQVGEKLRQTENRMVNLLHKDVRTRLMGLICQLANHYGSSANGNAYLIENFLTHEDIARLIGSSRQTVTTQLNQLESEGLLMFDRSEIRIPDIRPFGRASGL